MPTPRPLAIVLAVLVSAVAGAGAVTAEPLPEPAKAPAAMAEIVFYLARGEADACGRGCNEWIVAEGKIDADAAARFRRLLAKLGHRRPTIYFHSPGGSVVGGLELGRLIREQKLTVSVAHTIPLGCNRDKPLEKSCAALKRSGQELESEFDQTTALCNSSCVYVLAGGTVRVIPPWVKLGIHDVGLDPDKKPPPGALAEQAKKVAHTRIQEYLRDMGFDKALYTAAVAIPYTSHRFLERDEVVRFGIDRRDFGESVWRYVGKPKPEMDKRFFLRTDGDPVRYVDGLASLVCGVGSTMAFALVRQHGASEPASAGQRSVSISVNGQRIDLPYQIPSGEFDTRWASLPASAFDAVGEATIGISGFGPDRSDGSAGGLTLNMDGFSAAYAKFRKSCDEAARNVIAAVPSTLPSTAPWAKPSTIPFMLGDKTPWGQNPSAAPGPAVLQNTPAAPIPPGTKTVQSASQAAGSPTQAEPMQQSCKSQIADAPLHLTGRVTGFISDEQALAWTSEVEAELGVKISPAYLFLKRVKVERYPQSDNWATMAAIPENLDVKIGDVVELKSRYRDPSLPCRFIPWTIDRLVDRAG